MGNKDSIKYSVASVIVRTLNLHRRTPNIFNVKKIRQCIVTVLKDLRVTTIQKFQVLLGQLLMFVTGDRSLNNVLPHLLHFTRILRMLHLVTDTD